VNDIRYAQSPLLDMKTPVWRSRFIMAGLALVFLGLVGRAIHVQVLSKEFLQQKGEVHLVTTMSLPATRGRILDRNGQILASSIVTVSVAARPRQVREEDGIKRAQLAKILDVPQAELDRKLDDVSKNFVWLKRYLDASVAAEVAALKMKGLEVQRDFFRKYPEGAAAAHVVGFAGDSNVGLEGAERLGAHDVVAAAVPDPRQGVVLAEDRDGGDLVAVGGRTDLSAQCGLQPEDAVVMRDAVTIQEGPNRRHGVMLVPPGLRMVVDVVGQLQQLGAQVLEQPAEALAPLGRGALAGLESRRRGQNGRPLLRLGAHVLGVSRRRGGRQSGTRTRP